MIAAALAQGSGPRGPATRDGDVEAVRTAFLAQIDHDAPPDVAARWHDHFTTAPTPDLEQPVGRALAGLDADMVDDEAQLSDELNVIDDVVTLCDVVAARGAVPPISVGLFGRWGSGKSYFMALMRRRIDALQLAASQAKKDEQPTTYCSEIVQITFNAWHYMDADDLWATLAVHLFNGVAQIDPQDQRVRSRAVVLSELQARERQMASVDRRIARALSDRRLGDAAARMGLQSQHADALGLLDQISTTIRYTSAFKVLLTKRWWKQRIGWLIGLVATLAVMIGLAVALVTGAVSPAWLLAWIPAATGVAGAAAKWLHNIRVGLEQVNKIAADSGLHPRDITADRMDKDAKIVELRAELGRIDRLEGMQEWMKQRATSTDYTSHFGVISILRSDLEALVDKQRLDAPDRRIILYIDDLDRCPPTRVVEVLQAVHLLLAFPLFVAVVGVDPRWLLRSLERHYRQVLSTPDGVAGERAVDDLLTETTPHDYLEKIFQIPFSLRRMDPDGYGRLIGSLAGPAPEQPDTEASPPSPASEPDAAPVEPATPEVAPPEAPAQPGDAEAAAETRRGDAPVRVPPPDVAPNPPRLQITDVEVTALTRVSGLIGTPRAAKRLVNLYRLVRAGLDDDEIDSFVKGGRFRPLSLILAAQVGFPRVSSLLLAEVCDRGDEDTIADVLAGYAERLHRAHPSTGSAFDQGAAAEGAALVDALTAVATDPAFKVSVSELKPWVGPVARYSFEGALGVSDQEPRRASVGATPTARSVG